MSKKNQDNEICIYDSEEIAIKKIYKKYKKVIEKVKKGIFKQVEKKPFKNYYEINICDFSPQEMQAIKYYFVN
jgi:cytidylate kinase